MNNKKATKRALLTSVMALVMCVVMLVGTTFAWFTDTASTGVNKIQAGNLDVALEMNTGTKENPNWENAEGKTLNFTKKVDVATDGSTTEITPAAEILWEPGCRYELPALRVVNKGNLALKYKIQITGIQGDAKLNEVIDWTINDAAIDLTEQHLAAKAEGAAFTIKGVMQTTAGNEYQGLSIDGIAITVYATQDTVENDSFGPDYDANATYYPVIDLAGLKDAIKNGGNVTVDADVEVSGTDTLSQRTIISKPTTLQLNKKITSPDNMGNNSSNFIALIVAADTTINAGENGGIDTGVNGAYAINVMNGANLVINGGTYYGGGTAVQVQKGTVTINGGHFAVEPFSDARYGYNFLLNCIDSAYKDGTANIIVKGGTFVNFNPADCKAEGAGTNFVADGYSVISETKANGDVWYTVVKGTGVTAGTQADLNNAITSNATPTVKLTTAGTYTLPDELQGKDITVIGTKDTVVNMANNDCYHADNVSLEGVTVEFANEDYRGFKHTGKLTYKDCTITGKQFLYGTEVEFINCTFVQDAVDYNVWTYGAGNVLFKDCTFDCKGKAVLIYNEGHISSQNVEFQNCKFNASAPVAGKAAIEIDSRFTSYNVVIDKATADNVTDFSAGSASGSSVWNVKAQVKPVTVTVAGTVVYSK